MNKDLSASSEPLHRSLEDYSGIQKAPQEYYGVEYLSPKRLSSYGYQYSLAIKTQGQSFLNIGSSNYLLRLMLKSQNLHIIDTDIDIYTKPMISSALPYLPFQKKSFEIALCFQVLEHLPFDVFGTCLKEMARVAEKYLVISLPDRTLSKRQMLKRMIYKAIKHPREWGNYKIHDIDKEHFWEIGKSNLNLESIIKSISAEKLELVEHFRNPHFDYHHFFLLKI